MATTLMNLVTAARQQLAELTGLKIGSTVMVRQEDAGWRVHVEVVEKKSLPESQDILAIYELALDEAGNLLNFSRIGMRRRMDVAAASSIESGA